MCLQLSSKSQSCKCDVIRIECHASVDVSVLNAHIANCSVHMCEAGNRKAWSCKGLSNVLSAKLPMYWILKHYVGQIKWPLEQFGSQFEFSDPPLSLRIYLKPQLSTFIYCYVFISKLMPLSWKFCRNGGLEKMDCWEKVYTVLLTWIQILYKIWPHEAGGKQWK